MTDMPTETRTMVRAALDQCEPGEGSQKFPSNEVLAAIILAQARDRETAAYIQRTRMCVDLIDLVAKLTTQALAK
jgi:hypothetical protein